MGCVAIAVIFFMHTFMHITTWWGYAFALIVIFCMFFDPGTD